MNSGERYQLGEAPFSATGRLPTWVTPSWQPTTGPETPASRPPSASWYSSPPYPPRQPTTSPKSRTTAAPRMATASSSTLGPRRRRTTSASKTASRSEPARTGGPLAATILAALLLLPITGAETSLVDAHIQYDAVQLAGTIKTPFFESHVFVPPQRDPKRVLLSLVAEDLIVNWTDMERYDVAHPANWSRPYVGVQKGPTTHGEAQHGRATAKASFEAPSANFLIHGLASNEGPLMGFATSNAALKPNPGTQWVAGAHSREFSSTPDPNGTIIYFQLPAGATQTTLTNGTVHVQGNLTIYAWETVVDVTDQQGDTSYASGTRSQSPGPAPGTTLPAHERETRLLTINARNASATITIESGQILLSSAAVPLHVVGNALFSSALGRIGDHAVLQEDLLVDGRFQLEANNKTGSETRRLEGTLAFRPGEAHLRAGDQELGAAQTVARSQPPWWLMAIAAGTLVLSAAGYQRYKPTRIEDVELAFLSGRSKRANRLAQRLVRKTPRDPDAVFLYGTALLQQSDHERLIRKLEPLAKALKKGERRGVAYLLAVAAHVVNDEARTRKWGAEAAKDPELAKHLAEHGLTIGSNPASPASVSAYA